MPDVDPRLAAEVLVEGGWRGTGFLIADGLVLTVLHTLLGDDRPYKSVEQGITAKVRFQGDIEEAVAKLPTSWDPEEGARRFHELDLRWHPAKLVWPLTEELARSHDLALLSFDPGVTGLKPLKDVTAHVLQRRKFGCAAHGYPSSGKADFEATEIWAFKYISGELVPDFRANEPTRGVTVYSGFPTTSDGWKGLSGAAVWIDKEAGAELVGVAQSLTEGVLLNDEFRCWPISIVKDEEFWRLTGIKRVTQKPAEPTEKPLAAALDEGLYRFDRQRANTRFRAWLKGDEDGAPPILMRAGPPTRPAIILLRGHMFDEPSECAKRFAAMLADEFYPGLSGAYSKPITLSCGYPDDAAQLRFGQLLLDWARKYEDPNQPRPDKIELTPRQIVLDGLNAPDRPRVVVIEHNDECFTDNCRGVLRDVATMLAEWKPADPNKAFPPVVIVSAVVGTAAGPVESGFNPLTDFTDKAKTLSEFLEEVRKETPLIDGRPQLEFLLDLPALGDPAARMSDVRAWLSDLADREKAKVPETLPLDIEDQMLTLDTFPFRFARIAIRNAVAKLGVQR